MPVKYLKKFRPGSASGDTIIEVMISMAVLAVILAAAYAISTRSLQAGVDSQARGQALSYAQAQLELIKNADNSNNIGSYKVNYQFYINSSDGSVVRGSDTQNPFTITDTFDTSPASPTYQSFIVKVTWPGTAGQTNQTTLNYKAHNSFVCNSQLLDLTDCANPPTTPVTTPPPQVGMTLAANCGDGSTCNLAYGGSANLTWTTTNAQSCSASGGWSGSKSVNGGSYSTGSLTTTQNYVLTCNGTGSSNQASKTVTINIAPPPAPTLSFTADSGSLAYGGATTLRWTSGNTTSCNASGSWGGSVGTRGTYYTGALYSSKTYSLQCNGPGGGVSKVLTINVAPQPIPTVSYFFASPNPVAYGGASTYLYWGSTNATDCWSPQLGWIGTGGATPSGAIYQPTTYTLYCYNGQWSSPAQTTIQVPAPTPVMTGASYSYTGSNGQLSLSGAVDDHNVAGTTAWFEEPTCNIGAFPTGHQSIPTNTSYNSIYATIYPWTYYYCGYHNPYYFQICAQNVAGTACSNYYPLSQ